MTFTTEVILCTYNGAPFIIRQLESILAQTKNVDKISIYDDRSSDNTLTIIKDFVTQLPVESQNRFNIHLNEKNLGYAINFCTGISRATKDVLLFCDQDDTWRQDKVEQLLSLLAKEQTDMAFSDGLLIDQNDNIIPPNTVLSTYGLNSEQIQQFKHNAFEALVKRNYINGAAAAILRPVAQNALPLPCEMPHDYWLAIWCALHNGISATPQTLYNYRQHSENVIGIGATTFISNITSIWKHCDAPREREARIWQAILKRILSLPIGEKKQLAIQKSDWISKVVPEKKSGWRRGYEIALSIANGNYHRFSPPTSTLRDIFSLIKNLDY